MIDGTFTEGGNGDVGLQTLNPGSYAQGVYDLIEVPVSPVPAVGVKYVP